MGFTFYPYGAALLRYSLNTDRVQAANLAFSQRCYMQNSNRSLVLERFCVTSSTKHEHTLHRAPRSSPRGNYDLFFRPKICYAIRHHVSTFTRFAKLLFFIFFFFCKLVILGFRMCYYYFISTRAQSKAEVLVLSLKRDPREQRLENVTRPQTSKGERKEREKRSNDGNAREKTVFSTPVPVVVYASKHIDSFDVGQNPTP